ncbi:MAG TPA: enoyl-CoA hydratase-related protein [Burkholderiaceae bacterium]|nr:enoyl-CoA hydratase-related protein [Burkholderiaceae bacterium]
MSQPFETIQLQIVQGVATITLNRPDRLNSLNRVMLSELNSALGTVRLDTSARCLLLTGNGRAFCSGQDLDDESVDPALGPVDLGAVIEHGYGPIVLGIRDLPIPVVAAVNGVAAGAGANIALACDIVIAALSASFVQPFCRLGLLPGAGGTWTLPRLVGPARALGLALLGEPLEAADAQAWGLIWECVPDEQLTGRAGELAARLAEGPTLGFARTKQAIQASAAQTLEASLDLEGAFLRELGGSLDYREGVAAFRARRPPRFIGG